MARIQQLPAAKAEAIDFADCGWDALPIPVGCPDPDLQRELAIEPSLERSVPSEAGRSETEITVVSSRKGSGNGFTRSKINIIYIMRQNTSRLETASLPVRAARTPTTGAKKDY